MPRDIPPGYDYEDDLAFQSAAYLDRVLPEDAVWWHTPNQGHGVGRTSRAVFDAMKMAQKLKKMGMKPGIPDIMIVWQGRIFATDAKSKTGKLTDSQKAMFPKLESAGVLLKATYRTIEELESHLTDWGIPLRFRYSALTGQHVMKPSEASAMTAILNVKQHRARRAGRQTYAASKTAHKVT